MRMARLRLRIAAVRSDWDDIGLYTEGGLYPDIQFNEFIPRARDTVKLGLDERADYILIRYFKSIKRPALVGHFVFPRYPPFYLVRFGAILTWGRPKLYNVFRIEYPKLTIHNYSGYPLTDADFRKLWCGRTIVRCKRSSLGVRSPRTPTFRVQPS